MYCEHDSSVGELKSYKDRDNENIYAGGLFGGV